MNNRRFIKYSRRYRLAIAFFIVAIAVIATVTALGMTVFASPALESNVAVTSALFFVPTIAGAALMMGLFYWFSAENRRTSFFIDEEQPV